MHVRNLLIAACLAPAPAMAQALDFTTFGIPGSSVTTLPGTTFSVDGARAATNAARLDLGVKYAVAQQTFLYASGGAELSDRSQNIGGTAGLRIVW